MIYILINIQSIPQQMPFQVQVYQIAVTPILYLFTMLSSRKNTAHLISPPSENYNSSNSNSNRKAASLATPALLFYKPHKLDMDRSSARKSVRDSRQLNYCENHINTEAVYFSRVEDDDEDIIYYCSKCAGLLSDQGFLVSPIPSKSRVMRNSCMKNSQRNQSIGGKKKPVYPYPEREGEIKQFLEVLGERLQIVTDTTNSVKDILVSSQQFYGQQIEQINEYFETIIQSLQLEKNKCYNHILLERQNAEKSTRETLNMLQESDKEVQAMMADIQDNLDSVFSITWENYQLVMEAFDGRLKGIDQVIEEIQSQGISDVEFRKIEFAGVPDSINSLSEIIIQNSYGGGSLLEVTDPDGFSDTSYEQKSIFDKLKSKHNASQNNLRQSDIEGQKQQTAKPTHQRHNSLMFSFDFDAMKECDIRDSQDHGQVQNSQQHLSNDENSFCRDGLFLRKAQSKPEEESFEASEEEEPVMRNQKLNYQKCLFSDEPVDPVEGIKQVEELDVLEMPDEYLLQ